MDVFVASFSLRSVRCRRAFGECRASTPVRVIVRLMRSKKISSLRTRERAEKGGACKQKATRRNAIGQRKGARMQGNTHISFLRAWLQVALGHPLS